jgi:PEP-CTERM motif
MKKILVIGALAAMLAPTAFAHTIAIGSTNAGGPGSVTLWMGTYDHGGPIAQGSIQLVAGPSSVGATQAFTTVVTSIPSGLVAGDNYFFANATSAQWGALPSDSYTSAVNVSGLGPVVNWQGATFSGLLAGVYTYQLSGMTSANWNNINSFQDNWRGTLTISTTSTQVPEPATLAMLGFGLVGLVFARRRRETH